MSRNPGKTAKRADSLNPVDAADSVHPAGPAGAASTTAEKPAISEEAVQAATGKNWQDWFRLLDDAGAARMTHKEIVGIVGRLDEDDRVSGWWRQSIAVAYEKARGLREKHEHVDGYSVSASKTIPAIADQLFAAWEDEGVRQRWLSESLTIRKATPPKSLRITWHDGSHVDVYIYPKGDAKAQVSLEHKKLPGRDEAERQKAFWKEALQRLKMTLEAR